MRDKLKFVGIIIAICVDDELIGIPIIERENAIGIFAGAYQFECPYVTAIPIREEMYKTILSKIAAEQY